MIKKIITPEERLNPISYIKQIWNYRFLSYSLAKGEIKQKYSKSSFGVLYSTLQVVITLTVYWAIFGIVLNVDAFGIPYPLFALPGIIFWQYFSNTISRISSTLHDSENLISKLYFPRINLLLSRLLINVPELIIGLLIYIILLIIYNQLISFSIVWGFLLIFILIVITFGIGLWISMISLYNKNLGQVVIQLVQFCFFLTPVFYPGTIIPNSFKIFLYLNPIASIIEFFRSSLISIYPHDKMFILGIIIGTLMLLSGFFMFKKMERKITDML